MLRLRSLSLAVLWAAPVAAQELAPDLQSQVLAAQPQSYEDPVCDAKPKHFRVGGAATYINTAMEKPANRASLLGQSKRTVIEAITDEDQDSNPGAWYILGRVYLYQVDLVGADTAFTHVVALQPGCDPEIVVLRRRTWITIRNYALGEMQRSQLDSALATYRAGLTIYRGEADVFYVMASILETAERPDSVTYYLRLALEVEDTTETGARVRRNAVRKMSRIYARAGEVDSAVAYYLLVKQEAEAAGDTNAVRSAETQIARVYFNGERYPEALAAFRVMEARSPDNAAIKRNIATVFQSMGQVDSAQIILASLGGGGGGAGATLDTTSARFLINRGVNKYQEQKFEAAAGDFTRALKAEPSNRLAMINLGLSYNNLKDGPRLVETADRMIAREPLYELAYQLLLQGYVYQRDNKAHEASSRLDALPITIDSLNVQIAPGLATISGVAFGRSAPSAAMNLVFEFTDESGAVVASSDVAIPALDPQGRSEFAAQGQADGIVDWRYKVK